MARPTLLLAVAACGRINFAPLGDSGGDVSRDAAGDAVPAACDEGISVSINVPLTISTCATGLDRIDGCGPPATDEVVFKVFIPTSSSYTVRAYDTGTTIFSNGTNRLSPSSCAPLLCIGESSAPLPGNTTQYFVVEADAGGCATIDFLISQP